MSNNINNSNYNESNSDTESEGSDRVHNIETKRRGFSFGKIITFVTILLFFLFVSNWLLQIYLFFDPFIYIPYYTKKIEVKDDDYIRPYWDNEFKFKLDAYYSLSKHPNKVFQKNDTLIWSVVNSYGSFEKEEIVRVIEFPKKILNNGTLYFHCFLYNSMKSPDPKSNNFDPNTLIRSSYLTKFHRVELNTTHNLIFNKESNDSQLLQIEKKYKNKIYSHFKPFVQIDIVLQYKNLPKGHIPLDVVQDLIVLKGQRYLPIFYINEIGLRNAHLQPIIKENGITKNLTITFKKTNFGLYRIHKHFSHIFDTILHSKELPIKVSEKDIDNFRQMFFETPPLLLMATFLASFFHMLFEFLAFKSDIQHYRKNAHTFGNVSKTSLILNAVTHTFSFLFLFEKINETSRIIIFGAAISAIIEYWKLIRVFSYKNKKKSKKHESKQSKNIRENQDLDKMIFKYTIIISVPITFIYSTYNLFNKEYKSIYSWILEFTMAFIYLLGFVNMTPQIILNYKNKSVEAIPIKMFLYKAINTFIDDLFAFVVPMPNLTRLSMFRDDIVFIFFLYQWWKYPKNKEDPHKKME